jgi:hypothetical protein
LFFGGLALLAKMRSQGGNKRRMRFAYPPYDPSLPVGRISEAHPPFFFFLGFSNKKSHR